MAIVPCSLTFLSDHIFPQRNNIECAMLITRKKRPTQVAEPFDLHVG